MTSQILSATVQEIIEEMHRVRRMYVLKETMRYFSKRDTNAHTESVAEHLFGMQVLAQYFLPLEDPQYALDRYRINELILYHELGEIETGDIPMALKTDADREFEKGAAKRVADSLPAHLAPLAWERFEEYEFRKSPESFFVFAIDKIEPIFQMLHPLGYPLFKEQGYTREIAVGNKIDATEQYPYMRKFVDAWTEHMESIDAFARETA
jgi:putative hydrolase of HD superfamily